MIDSNNDDGIIEDTEYRTIAQMILDEVERQDPELLRETGIVLTVNRRWLVRIWWMLPDEPEIFPLEQLVHSRPELLENLYTAQGTAAIVRACMELASYTAPRGYDVGIRGMDRWNMFKLDLYNFFGGFHRANRA